MFTLRYDKRFPPAYMTAHSAAADLCACVDAVLAPTQSSAVRTGVYITAVAWEQVPEGYVPEITLRARSGLAARHGITLLNGVGTIDADYRGEIKVLLYNCGRETFRITAGDRIAQMVVALSHRLVCLPQPATQRQGGFGSTDRQKGVPTPAQL